MRIIEVRIFDPGKNYYWPVPQIEIEVNRNMTQNTGYWKIWVIGSMFTPGRNGRGFAFSTIVSRKHEGKRSGNENPPYNVSIQALVHGPQP